MRTSSVSEAVGGGLVEGTTSGNAPELAAALGADAGAGAGFSPCRGTSVGSAGVGGASELAGDGALAATRSTRLSGGRAGSMLGAAAGWWCDSTSSETP
jgi:hypothetical protein